MSSAPSAPPTRPHPLPHRRGALPAWSRALLVLVAVVALLYAMAIALLWWQQERLLFQPQRLPADHRFGQPPDVHETWVDVPGARLNALHLRLPAPDGVVFFLHGNAGSLQDWFVGAPVYRQANMDLFMIDYRGYGKSSGRITSQAQLMDDVRAAWQAVAPQYAGKRRVVYGRSLGTGLAAMLSAEVQPDALVLVSAYSSMVDLARRHYPWVPPAALRYPLRTDEALARVSSPVWLAHGGRDTLIPPDHAARLQAVSPQARLLLVPEAAHNDIHEFDAYLRELQGVLRGRP